MHTRIARTRAFILTLALAAAPATTTTAQDTTTPRPAQQAKAAMDTLGAATGRPDSTSGSFTGTLNLAAIEQPGGTFPFRGTYRSQMILDGTGRLTVVTSMGQNTLNYLGYRTDTKQYYSISMDARKAPSPTPPGPSPDRRRLPWPIRSPGSAPRPSSPTPATPPPCASRPRTRS